MSTTSGSPSFVRTLGYHAYEPTQLAQLLNTPTLTAFDFAVIAYAQGRNEPSDDVYRRVDSKCGRYGRSFFTEQQLLRLLAAVKQDDASGH